MQKLISYLPYVTLFAGGWALANGILHDIFILIQHKKPYDRDLLRLLMDGHILITCGIIQVIAFNGLQQNQNWAMAIATVAALSLLVYCGMIFPFLKSMVTISINLFVLILLGIKYFNS